MPTHRATSPARAGAPAGRGRRRAVVGLAGAALLLAGGLLAVPHGPQRLPGATTPSSSLHEVFVDDFTTDTTIDRSGTGRPGFRWYTDAPFGWESTPSGALQVADGVLTIDPPRSRQNFQLATGSAASGQGRGFRYGYFEARLAFDPRHAPGSDGFPAFWGVSWDQVRGADRSRTAELDVFEAMAPDGRRRAPYRNHFVGTVHDLLLRPEVDRASYGNNLAPLPGTDWTQFHSYGCWWQPGLLRWYFDGHLVLTQRYSATQPPTPNPENHPPGTFSVLDEDPGGQMLILGTGAGYPLRVDWVRVLQAR